MPSFRDGIHYGLCIDGIHDGRQPSLKCRKQHQDFRSQSIFDIKRVMVPYQLDNWCIASIVFKMERQPSIKCRSVDSWELLPKDSWELLSIIPITMDHTDHH
eukprot:404218_1